MAFAPIRGHHLDNIQTIENRLFNRLTFGKGPLDSRTPHQITVIILNVITRFRYEILVSVNKSVFFLIRRLRRFSQIKHLDRIFYSSTVQSDRHVERIRNMRTYNCVRLRTFFAICAHLRNLRMSQNYLQQQILCGCVFITTSDLSNMPCTLNLSFKKYQYSPGLQAGDDEPGRLLSLLRRLKDGGAGRGLVSFFLIPGLKAGAIQDRANFFK